MKLEPEMSDAIKNITMTLMARNEFADVGKDNMSCLIVEFKN